jgi:hypothetical protein
MSAPEQACATGSGRRDTFAAPIMLTLNTASWPSESQTKENLDASTTRIQHLHVVTEPLTRFADNR